MGILFPFYRNLGIWEAFLQEILCYGRKSLQQVSCFLPGRCGFKAEKRKEGYLPQDHYELHNTWCKILYPCPETVHSGPHYKIDCRVLWLLFRGNNIQKFGTKAHLLKAGAAVLCQRIADSEVSQAKPLS